MTEVRSAIIEAQKRAQQKVDFIDFNEKVQDFGGFQTSSHLADLMYKGNICMIQVNMLLEFSLFLSSF